MKRLVILTQYFGPEIGAPQNRLLELAVGLKSKGWDITVVTGMPNYPQGKIFKEYKGRFSCSETIESIKVKRYWLFASNSRRTVPRIFSMITFSLTSACSLRFILRERFDFLFVESPPLTLGLTGFALAYFSGAKLVFNASDLWPLTARELGYLSPGILYNVLEKVENFLYKRSFLCTGQSEETIDYISRKGAQRTYLLRNGVDPSRFRRIQHLRNSGRVKLVYAGLLGVAQGILNICQNINFTDLEAEFHIYGAGAESEPIQSYLALNPPKSIFYHGIVSRQDVPTVLSWYDVSLISLVKNIYGAVPSKLYESMAAGLPIMFSGEGEGKKIVETYDLGWVSKPGDYQGLSMNILKLHSQMHDIEIKRGNCLMAAEKIFNRPRQIEDFHNYLSQFELQSVFLK